jgi:hypothetical protein
MTQTRDPSGRDERVTRAAEVICESPWHPREFSNLVRCAGRFPAPVDNRLPCAGSESQRSVGFIEHQQSPARRRDFWFVAGRQRRSSFRFDDTGELNSSQATGLGLDDRTPPFVKAAVWLHAVWRCSLWL